MVWHGPLERISFFAKIIIHHWQIVAKITSGEQFHYIFVIYIVNNVIYLHFSRPFDLVMLSDPFICHELIPMMQCLNQSSSPLLFLGCGLKLNRVRSKRILNWDPDKYRTNSQLLLLLLYDTLEGWIPHWIIEMPAVFTYDRSINDLKGIWIGKNSFKKLVSQGLVSVDWVTFP